MRVPVWLVAVGVIALFNSAIQGYRWLFTPISQATSCPKILGHSRGEKALSWTPGDDVWQMFRIYLTIIDQESRLYCREVRESRVNLVALRDSLPPYDRKAMTFVDVRATNGFVESTPSHRIILDLREEVW